MNHSKQIRYGALLSYVAIGVNIIAGIIYTPWMISVIGKADYGIYGVATSIITMCTMDFGLGSAITRFIAKYQAEGDDEKVKKFLGITLKLYLIIDVCIAIALCIIYASLQNIYVSFTAEEIYKLKVVFVVIGTFTLFTFPAQIFNGVITAKEQFVFQKTMDLCNKLCIILFMIIALSNGGGLYALIVVNAVVGCLMAFLKLIYLKKRKMFEVLYKYWEWGMVKEIFSFSVWITLILILQRFILNITPTILGITSGTEEIAVFTAATTIEGYTYTFAGALTGFFMTRIMNMYYGNNANAQAVEELMIKIGRIQLFVVGAICSIFFALGEEFALLWLGEGFVDVYPVAALLIAPMIVMSTQGIADTALTAKGEVKYRTLGLVATAVTAIITSLILSRYYGAVGAGIGIFVGNILGNVFVQNIIYQKVLQINVWKFFKECHMSMCIPIIATFLLGIFIRPFFYLCGWVWFGGKCMLLLMMYIIITWCVSVKQEERESVLRGVKKMCRNRKKD